jgi:hypothetical protein
MVCATTIESRAILVACLYHRSASLYTAAPYFPLYHHHLILTPQARYERWPHILRSTKRTVPTSKMSSATTLNALRSFNSSLTSSATLPETDVRISHSIAIFPSFRASMAASMRCCLAPGFYITVYIELVRDANYDQAHVQETGGSSFGPRLRARTGFAVHAIPSHFLSDSVERHQHQLQSLLFLLYPSHLYLYLLH